jgi:hypothetical protein
MSRIEIRLSDVVRLLHHAESLVIEGRSYRMRETDDS